MKIVVFGDIHGRLEWYDVVQQENPDLTIFLGDYVSTHEGISADQQCGNLEDILNFKQEYPDKVILLRGNHDMQHLGYSWAECSGLNRTVRDWMMTIKDRFLEMTQWVHTQDGIVFSHAGVSKVWMQNVGLDNVEDINALEPSEKFGFWPCKLSDYSGISETQPPTWIRPWTLIDCSYGNYTQVVGHTAFGRHVSSTYKTCITNVNDECIRNYKSGFFYDNNSEDCQSHINHWKTTNQIWACDAMPNQYLVVEDGKFIPRDVIKHNN